MKNMNSRMLGAGSDHADSSVILFIQDPCGGDECRIGMNALIVKEDICAERFKNLAFFNTAEEEDLVDPHVPCAQSADHSFVSGRISCCHEGCSDGNGILGKLLLYNGNGL